LPLKRSAADGRREVTEEVRVLLVALVPIVVVVVLLGADAETVFVVAGVENADVVLVAVFFTCRLKVKDSALI